MDQLSNQAANMSLGEAEANNKKLMRNVFNDIVKRTQQLLLDLPLKHLCRATMTFNENKFEDFVVQMAQKVVDESVDGSNIAVTRQNLVCVTAAGNASKRGGQVDVVLKSNPLQQILIIELK